ncbi:alpha- and gamma-adaptin-binding protein p34-like [Dysidea avara]|uniref:alpha- and gamma-adaptin-binding protein p34-like n=1 Tax=Dysidea avara TaxID=196820 RepID=UPI003317EDCB
MATCTSSSNIAVIFDCTCCDGTKKTHVLANEIAGVAGGNDDGVTCYNVDNKYYTATIHLHCEHIPPEGAEAILLIINIGQENSFDEAKKKWSQLQTSSSAEILILVSYGELSTGIEPSEHPVYQAAQVWCVEQGFELVWWQQGAQGSSQQGSLLDEQTGVDRIKEALQAHTWSNMTMKNSQETSHNSRKDKKSEDPKSREIINDMLGEPPRDDEDKFGELFDKFMSMKETAKSLPHEQRKEFAEKVVMQFWQAIGGDEDEVRSSDSD